MGEHESLSKVRQESGERSAEQKGEYVVLQKKLLEDFEDFVKDVSPIEGDFSGDPKEVLRLPRERRKGALADFKDILVRQRKAFARCRQDIEEAIEYKGGGVPKEQLLEIVGRFADSYSFSDVQRNIFEGVINEYCRVRDITLVLREQYPNDVDLLNELTGGFFEIDQGVQIEVSVGPYCFEIVIPNELFEKSGEASTHGILTEIALDDGEVILCIFINSVQSAVRQLGTLEHEREHLKDRYFMKVIRQHLSDESFDQRFGADLGFEYTVGVYKDLKRVYNAEQDRDPLWLVENHLRRQRRFALMRVKSEFFAHLQNHTLHFLQEHIEPLFFLDGIYDFLLEDRKYLQRELQDDEEFQGLVENILVREYQDIIVSAVHSLVRLVDEGGYTEWTAISLLVDVSMQDWSKTVARLLEQEKDVS